MRRYVFGIDIGGTTIKCGLFEEDGLVVEQWELDTRTDDGGRYILPDTGASILAKMAELGIKREDVVGVGIGVPGPVKADGTVAMAVNLGWGFTDIAGELSAYTNLEVKAGNDANVAALGEMWKGGGQGYTDLIMVTLGTGVGGGIIVNGQIVTGAHGAGGEIGHGRVDMDEREACNCGTCGCLEQTTSATGIVKLADGELAASDEASLLRDTKVSAKSVFEAYGQGDALAKRVVERFAETLGNALAIYCCVADPGVIVIGGGVSKAGTLLIDLIKKYFVRDAFSACKDTKLELAQLGNAAGIYGAAKLMLDA